MPVEFVGPLAAISALALRVFGPPADQLGAWLEVRTEHWKEQRKKNLIRIVKSASQKLGDGRTGYVPDRVLARILDEGTHLGDEVAVSYLGGVLASSKTNTARDDRGAALVDLVTRLATYDLRTHYILYSSARHLLLGSGINLGNASERLEATLYIPATGFESAMTFEPGEDPTSIRSFSLWALANENLIESFCAGAPEELLDLTEHAPGPGIAYILSVRGVQLFMWGCGLGGAGVAEFVDPNVDLPPQGIDIFPVKGAALVKDLAT